MASFAPALYERPGIEGQRRRQIVQVLQAALAAVEPAEAVRRFLRRQGDTLWVHDRPYDLAEIRHIYVVGAGKAGAPMAQAVEEALGERITAGAVNVKYAHVAPTRLVRVREAGHPIPDEAGVQGSREIAALLQQAEPSDLVICLISGGGSALLPLPVEGVSLADLQALTDALLHAGANIVEINIIRKHLDRLKGGKLAAMTGGARVASLILSDVVGNPLDAIASGPTVPDGSTFADAWAILERYGLAESAPAAIRSFLRAGCRGEVAENPRAGDPLFARVQNVIVASNDLAAQAAERAAQELGYHTLLLSTYVEGEAREVARVFAALAKEELASSRPVPRPACLIAGGETTVTVRGRGRGGRNQEMALSGAIRLAGIEDVALVCLATDGSDGPTDASGALADGATVSRAKALGLDAWAHLENNDAYPFFAALGDLLVTGPTNTNVNDLTLVFVW
jgi:hydroxypyruvate reductase